MRHLFLSPHLDDAVASCGGTITKLVDSGEQVTIFNLFCGAAASPYPPFASELHELWGSPNDVVRLRRAEDEAAAAKLGTHVHYEDVPDSLYRRDQNGNWMYGNEGDIFGPRHPDDDMLVPYLVQRVRIYMNHRESQIYTTLGIGHHVDHLIAFEVGQLLVRGGHKVLFYEDFPYANDEETYQQRLVSLPTDWTSLVVTFDNQCLSSKIDAFGYYRSQIPMLFGNRERMYVIFTEFAKKVSGSNHLGGERYWKCPEIGS